MRPETILLPLLLIVLSFIFLEGISSSLLGLYTLTKPSVRERVHTQYDKELGWVNIPNIEVRDMYGPGIFFKTNSQGFRNDEDFRIDVPDGKIRVICSGDSFTLGYGVDNHHTWCHQLISADKRLETVNMGQGGYGIDQAYLWYMRDGAKLRHDIHIFAFITDGFLRMKHDKFLDYGKPVLQVKDDVLMPHNVPVPRWSYLMPWLTESTRRLRDFRLVELATKVYSKISSPVTSLSTGLSDYHTQTVATKVFETLSYTNKIKSSISVLVYLPTERDYSEDTSEFWRAWLTALSLEMGFVFIDLVKPFKKLPGSEVGSLFRGHYSEKGNEYIANHLYERLFAVDEISRRFGPKARRMR